MNVIYSMIGNSWEILMGIIFIFVIRYAATYRLRISLYIPQIPNNLDMMIHDKIRDGNVNLRDKLTVEGINASEESELARSCSESGIICHHNIGEISKALKSRGNIRVVSNEYGSVVRKMHDAGPASGIIIACILDNSLVMVS